MLWRSLKIKWWINSFIFWFSKLIQKKKKILLKEKLSYLFLLLKPFSFKKSLENVFLKLCVKDQSNNRSGSQLPLQLNNNYYVNWEI